MAVRQVLRSILGRRDGDSSDRPPFRKKTYRLGGLLKDVAALGSRSLDLVRIYAFKDMSPAMREAIMVAVARANECRYCSFAHREWALAAGLEQDELDQLERGVHSEIEQSTYLATDYARILSLGGFGPAPLDIEAQLDSTFSLRERRDIETVARMMTVANLVGNTVDALLARLEGQSVDDSNLADELVLTAGFSAVAPWVVLLLAVLGRKSPVAVFRAFQQFSSAFEQQSAEQIEPEGTKSSTPPKPSCVISPQRHGIIEFSPEHVPSTACGGGE